MSRRLPLCPNPLPMPARGTFEPSGAHELRIDLGMSGELPLSLDDARRFKRAIEAFETEVMRIDGHSDLTNRVTKVLGEF